MFDFFKEVARILSHVQVDPVTNKLTLTMVVDVQDRDGNYLLFVAPTEEPTP